MNAVITGASKGLGAAIARALVDRGWGVVLDARRAEDLAAVASSLDGDVVTVPGDIADAAHRAELVDAAQRLGGIDLVVNNASTLGPTPQPTLAAYPLDELAHVYRVNVVGPLGLT